MTKSTLILLSPGQLCGTDSIVPSIWAFSKLPCGSLGAPLMLPFVAALALQSIQDTKRVS